MLNVIECLRKIQEGSQFLFAQENEEAISVSVLEVVRSFV